MSPKQWIQRTNAIGLISKGGKYSIGTYAHPDLAFEFASWLSVEFIHLLGVITNECTSFIFNPIEFGGIKILII